jgi:hypothetical protein
VTVIFEVFQLLFQSTLIPVPVYEEQILGDKRLDPARPKTPSTPSTSNARSAPIQAPSDLACGDSNRQQFPCP